MAVSRRRDKGALGSIMLMPIVVCSDVDTWFVEAK
jgi:hypothetical protein